jgi:antitoxin (DNA-binding transcriptional repressor) of toxin-antitoxin stability system
MPQDRVDVAEAQENVVELIRSLAPGREIIITADGNAVARLTLPPRIPDLHPGAFEETDDFDVPLPDESGWGR